jgi:hypothetical protein
MSPHLLSVMASPLEEEITSLLVLLHFVDLEIIGLRNCIEGNAKNHYQ